MDHEVVRVSQCSAGDGMISTADCGVTLIENIPLSGRTFNEQFVFGKFVVEIAFVKLTKDDN